MKLAVNVTFQSLYVEITEATGKTRSWYSRSVNTPCFDSYLYAVQIIPNWLSHLQCV